MRSNVLEDHADWLAYLSAAMFAGLFLSFPLSSPGSPVVYVASYLGIGSHLVLFPVVAVLPAPLWARIAGWAWLTADVILNAMSLNGVTNPDFMAFRLGGHVLAATWIAIASLEWRGWRGVVGLVLAAWLGGYSLVAPWVPQAVFFPAFIVLIAWLVLVGRSFTGRPQANVASPARV